MNRPTSYKSTMLGRFSLVGAAMFATLGVLPAAATPTLETVYTFGRNATDGRRPQGNALIYTGPAMYVATPYGGPSENSGGVFQLKPKSKAQPLIFPWVEKMVFGASPGNSQNPQDLTYAQAGPNKVFFTTGAGAYEQFFGSILQTDLEPNNLSSTFAIHTFAGGSSDGAYPVGALVEAPLISNNSQPPYIFSFIGASAAGGAGGNLIGCGALYLMSSPPTPNITSVMAWTTSVLHSFTTPTGADGCGPNTLATNTADIYYGTTITGGSDGRGTVFMLSSPEVTGAGWDFTTLYTFHTTRTDGNPDGDQPTAGLILGKDGNLYGTTSGGGTYGLGTVFELQRPAQGQTAWTEIPLHDFTGLNLSTIDGTAPQTGLVQNKAGVLFGVTYQGGSAVNPFGLTQPGAGTIFSLTPAKKTGVWTEAVLHAFSGPDGAYPASRPVMVNSDGASTILLGTTSFDTTKGAGTVYRFTP